jgi:hypothetical protein
MKVKTLTQLLMQLVPLTLLTGCVGYNSAVFMTKSNVGLDFDTKPPTAEISVARREAVIAPAIGNGKTPPFMASFQMHQNGLQSFLFGISQTFSGGDAAVAMAKLYDLPTTNSNFLTNCDSSLEMSGQPFYKILFWGKGFPETNRIRPFIFGTDTSLGVKVAWSGLSAQMPDTLRVGFSRKEFAWAPLSHIQTNGTHLLKIPSFLATVDKQLRVGALTNTSLRQIQFFATGDAARYLTLQEDVRKAMIYRSDPAAPVKAAEASRLIQQQRIQATQLEGEKLSKHAAELIDQFQQLGKLDQAGAFADQAQLLNLNTFRNKASAEEKSSYLKAAATSSSPQRSARVKTFINSMEAELLK